MNSIPEVEIKEVSQEEQQLEAVNEQKPWKGQPCDGKIDPEAERHQERDDILQSSSCISQCFEAITVIVIRLASEEYFYVLTSLGQTQMRGHQARLVILYQRKLKNWPPIQYSGSRHFEIQQFFMSRVMSGKGIR
ncbi:hypothetical protein pb186bvf_017357 [Paramecium bursaria]